MNLYKNKKKLFEKAELSLYGDKMVLLSDGSRMELSFDRVEVVTVLGKNKLNIYVGNKVYQIKGSKRFNALKYVNIYYHYKNIKEGNTDVEFLGL